MLQQVTPVSRRVALGRAAAGATALLAATWPAAILAKPATIHRPLLGSAAAPKRLILWGSLTCPYTAMLVDKLLGIQRDMPKVVAIEWHHFPTHPPDPALHVAALAFKGDQFWRFATTVLGQIYAAGGSYDTLTPARIEQIATSISGSPASVRAALRNQALWIVVRQDLIAGKLMRVSKTPGLFFNGYFLTPDGIPNDLEGFDRELRKMVAA